jgi:hypothetical protein
MPDSCPWREPISAGGFRIRDLLQRVMFYTVRVFLAPGGGLKLIININKSFIIVINNFDVL